MAKGWLPPRMGNVRGEGEEGEAETEFGVKLMPEHGHRRASPIELSKLFFHDVNRDREDLH